MKPTELRIGNSCLYKINGEEKGKEIIIDAQDLVAISQFLVANKTSPYYAIPLTEEWLKKFGFEKREGSANLGFLKTIEWHSAEFDEQFMIDEMENSFYYDSLLVDSIHQLQNLYFALTGEELTLQK